MLASVQTISAFLKLISLPAPLYSLCLALICVSGIGVFFAWPGSIVPSKAGDRTFSSWGCGWGPGSVCSPASFVGRVQQPGKLPGALIHRNRFLSHHRFFAPLYRQWIRRGFSKSTLRYATGVFQPFREALKSRLKNLLKSDTYKMLEYYDPVSVVGYLRVFRPGLG